MKKVLFILTVYCLLPTVTFAQSVDLLWQGEGYTPAFYQGRTLWSRQSRVTFVAIPQDLGNAANLNYKWTRNGTVLGNWNGVGKSTLSFVDSALSRTQTIKIEILSGQGKVLAQSSAVVTPTLPTLLVYENNPLYGFMFHKEVSGIYPLKEREVSFAAFPLFFSILDRLDSNLAYEWRTNTGVTGTGASVTYRTPEETSGSAAVSISLSNQDEFMQSAKKNFLVEFNNEE